MKYSLSQLDMHAWVTHLLNRWNRYNRSNTKKVIKCWFSFLDWTWANIFEDICGGGLLRYVYFYNSGIAPNGGHTRYGLPEMSTCAGIPAQIDRHVCRNRPVQFYEPAQGTGARSKINSFKWHHTVYVVWFSLKLAAIMIRCDCLVTPALNNHCIMENSK